MTAKVGIDGIVVQQEAVIAVIAMQVRDSPSPSCPFTITFIIRNLQNVQ
jgi:hypothetical protein